VWERLPIVVTDCNNSSQCVAVSNASQLSQYDEGARALERILQRAVQLAVRATGNSRAGGSLLKVGSATRKKAIAESRAFPATTDQCR
jgi:hypothetical protein